MHRAPPFATRASIFSQNSRLNAAFPLEGIPTEWKRIAAMARLGKRTLRLIGRFALVNVSSLLLSSCIGREEKLPSGEIARILRVYRDEAVADSIPGAYGSALVVSYCATSLGRPLADDSLGIVAFARYHAGSATTIVLDRHETPWLLVFGCGSASRSAYVYDGSGEWHRVLPR
jgi:hypothetical protein